MAEWSRVARRIRVPLGFLFAILYFWLANPSWRFIGFGAVLIVPGLLIRAFASGHVRKNEALATTGPYAYTRNPLYLGSMLIAFGFGAASGNWLILGILAALFAAIYIPTIQDEENYLRAHFAGFAEYAARVPRLLPRLSAAQSNQHAGEFSRQLYLHHREYNSLMGAGAIYLALALKLVWWHLHHA